MKRLKSLLSLALVLVMVLSFAVPAMASGRTNQWVPGAWYPITSTPTNTPAAPTFGTGSNYVAYLYCSRCGFASDALTIKDSVSVGTVKQDYYGDYYCEVTINPAEDLSVAVIARTHTVPNKDYTFTFEWVENWNGSGYWKQPRITFALDCIGELAPPGTYGITYKASGKTKTEKKAAATIKYGEVKLAATLTADKKGGPIGESIKLTLNLKNSGTVDFQNLTITDPTLGEVFANQTVVAGQTVTLEKDVPIAETVDYQFTVKGEDATGNAVETASERITVTAVDPSQVVVLNVEASAQPETVYTLPGTVKFHVKVTNTSAIDVQDVTVSASGVNLYTFPTILAGETREFTRDVHVSMAGQFRFDAKVKNQLNETDTFESNIIRIAHELPTPEPTAAPIVTPPKPVYEQVPETDGLPEYVGTLQNTLGILYKVFMVLGAVCLALLLIGVVRRIQANVQSAKAQDHLERGSYRDYTQPAPKGRKEKKAEPKEAPVTRPIGEDKEAPAIPDADSAEPVEDGELMAETLRKLYPNENKTDAAVTVEVEGEEPKPAERTSEDSAFRRRSQRHME